MTVLRIACRAVKSGSSSLFSNDVNTHRYFASILIRSLSSVEVTKNISLISDDKRKIKVKNFKLESPTDKPLAVMLTWLMAKKRHIFKYADIYIDQGFDVLNVSVTPWQLLWPTKGTQVVAANVLKFLDSNPSYSPLSLHGFSVGGYVWSEVMVQMAAEKQRYQPLIDRIAGQVWDSTADITEMSEGVPVAVFPKNLVLQNTLKQYILYHLKAFDKVATCHYIRASQIFHTNLINAPALFFVSKIDPIGAESSNLRAKENWEQMGMQVYFKTWNDTSHVGHFRQHPKEYREELEKFIEKIYRPELVSEHSEKVQVKQ